MVARFAECPIVPLRPIRGIRHGWRFASVVSALLAFRHRAVATAPRERAQRFFSTKRREPLASDEGEACALFEQPRPGKAAAETAGSKARRTEQRLGAGY